MSSCIPYTWGDWKNDRYAFTDDDRCPQVLATVTVRREITG
ncbi:hypothetical protein ACFY91_25425 [Streptomyces albogriseolus]